MQAGVITYKKVMIDGTTSFLQRSFKSFNISKMENKSMIAEIIIATYKGDIILSLIIK
jgi:hypothetical protein